MRLMRGSGLDGLAGMPESSRLIAGQPARLVLSSIPHLADATICEVKLSKPMLTHDVRASL